MENVAIVNILKQVLDSSSLLITWALAIGAASVATIVSTSYIRPASFLHRLPYLIFIPGWFSLGYSLYLGDKLARSYIALLMVKSEIAKTIPPQINDLYSDQRWYLFQSVLFFGIWLVIFLLTWVFSNQISYRDKS